MQVLAGRAILPAARWLLPPTQTVAAYGKRLETEEFFDLNHRSALFSRFGHKGLKKPTDQVVHGCISTHRDLPGSAKQPFVDR